MDEMDLQYMFWLQDQIELNNATTDVEQVEYWLEKSRTYLIEAYERTKTTRKYDNTITE